MQVDSFLVKLPVSKRPITETLGTLLHGSCQDHVSDMGPLCCPRIPVWQCDRLTLLNNYVPPGRYDPAKVGPERLIDSLSFLLARADGPQIDLLSVALPSQQPCGEDGVVDSVAMMTSRTLSTCLTGEAWGL
jgi:hypothetical protein